MDEACLRMGAANQEPCHAQVMPYGAAAATQCSRPAGQTALGQPSIAAARLGTALALGSVVEPNWTCPFCSLHCDGFALEGGPQTFLLRGTDCPRALAGLAAHAVREAPVAWIDGATVTAEDAIAEAGRRLWQWRQPLFGGLGTDLAGARALFRLAARTGATCDHADGEALAHGLRALQDRGQFHTTLAEIRA